MIKIEQEKKKAMAWDGKQTECFLAIIKELQVIKLMDGKKFRTVEIFKKVEETFKDKGYNRTHMQLLEKFKAMKKRFKATIKALSESGAKTKNKEICPFFEELSEIFGHQPIANQIDNSTILTSDLDEIADCATGAEMFVITSKSSELETGKFMEHTGGCSSMSSTSTRPLRSSSSKALQNLPSTSTCSLEDNSTTLPSLDSREVDNSNKLDAPSKKRKIRKTPPYSRHEGPRSGMKNIMQQFTEQIIESQKDLLAKTIEEQHKLDKEMFQKYSHIFLQQTQMLLTGLQNLNPPLSTNYPTSFQQFPGVSTKPIKPMVIKTSLHQSKSMQQMFSHQNDKNIDHPSSHEAQARSKPDQIKNEGANPKLKIPPKSIKPKTISRSETIPHSVVEEDKRSSDSEYEQVEYLNM